MLATKNTIIFLYKTFIGSLYKKSIISDATTQKMYTNIKANQTPFPFPIDLTIYFRKE